LKVYPIETIIAEKYQTIVRLGMSSTRLKDHLDLYVISKAMSVNGVLVMKAVQGTFARRGTAISLAPDGLSEAFYNDKAKQKEWKSVLTAYNVPKGTGLDEACDMISLFVVPVVSAMVNDHEFAMVWKNGKWKKIEDL
jgi:hypothetical protein